MYVAQVVRIGLRRVPVVAIAANPIFDEFPRLRHTNVGVNVNYDGAAAIDDYRSVLGPRGTRRDSLLLATRKTENRIHTAACENKSRGRAGKISQELSACWHVHFLLSLRAVVKLRGRDISWPHAKAKTRVRSSVEAPERAGLYDPQKG